MSTRNDKTEHEEPDETLHPTGDIKDAKPKKRRTIGWIAVVSCIVVAAVIAAVLVIGASPKNTDPNIAPVTARPTPTTSAQAQALSLAQTLALPEANYAAVIPGLIPWTKTISSPVQVGTITTITPLYGADKTTAVARLNKTDFMNQPTVVVVVKTDGTWSQILTPARVTLPSRTHDDAPAQSAAWVRSADLTGLVPVSAHIDVDLSKLTLTVVGENGQSQTFPVTIGTKKTPTPSQVSGYLEERYVDPSQGTGTQPIQFTSLHSQVEDSPVSGGVGGPIAMHYYDARGGALSHGCLRLNTDAVNAVNALPLGSIVTVRP